MSDPAAPRDAGLPSTESVSARTRDLDLLSSRALVDALNAEDALVAAVVAAEAEAVAAAIDLIAARLRGGGSWVSFGAGTSGRLAVLDASELPPTFGVPPGLVRARIAGGDRALREATEGAEDDAAQGAADAASEGLGPRDVAVGVAASGRTPYVIGALGEARRRGAAAVAVVCDAPTPLHALADVTIAPRTGAEALSGSTRLKAGTAQKLVLNQLSTGVMIRLGRVYGNLMVGVVAGNAKLRARAARLTAQITGADAAAVERALAEARGDVRVACVMLKRGVDAAEASARLERAGGSLRAVVG
ncbi:MAG TPA: N-acetylmuramic acid 6-phosphate etherase [Planctomycetota bacterium]|nr:N-acetylmuramic acid 6-phosphate etherase [Planctomycetota bacterium]